MKVIAFYTNDMKNRGPCYLSSKNKLDYIFSILSELDYYFEVLSLCTVTNKRIKKCRTKLTSTSSIVYMSSSPRKSLLSKLAHLLWDPIKTFFFLIRNIEEGERVYIYHSTAYHKIIRLIKVIKHIYIIMEVEEIYSDVTNDAVARRKELDFLQVADAYIFPTQLLSKVVNLCNKPEVIIHGTYQVEYDRNVKLFTGEKGNEKDRIIHCVYAGTLDPRKGGAYAAASSAEHLPSNYHVHILGFGSDDDVINMKKLIAKISCVSDATVTYDGLLSGEEYIRFIQNCDIGLSTQDPNGAFNGTSFPSKILSYMANGLNVVSIRIPAIETSKVSKEIFYYDEQTPENIARAILSVDVNSYHDNRKIIKQLSNDFMNQIKIIIDE